MTSAHPERFWARVPVGEAGCWLWPSHGGNGYGACKFNGRQRGAHQVAYELARGPIPKGLFVCHHCDTPRCVRPDHLFLGAHLDNMADARAKRRMGKRSAAA